MALFNLPPELERKIHSYIEPNPLVYTRLATVSRSWYSVFTSDEKWRALDLLSKRTNLFRRYSPGRDIQDQLDMARRWSLSPECAYELVPYINSTFLLPRHNPQELCLLDVYDHCRFPTNDSPLSTLGLLRCFRMNPHNLDHVKAIITTVQCARVAIGLNYRLLFLVKRSVLRRYPGLVRQCVRIDPLCLNWLHIDLLMQHELLFFEVMRRGEGHDLRKACIRFFTHNYDRDLVWEAVEYQHGLAGFVEKLDGEDHKLLIKAAFYQRLLQFYSRDQLKEIFSRHVEALYSDVELFRVGIVAWPRLLVYASATVRDDEEVIMQAISVDHEAVRNASPRLLADVNFCTQAVDSKSSCFFHIPIAMSENVEFRRRLPLHIIQAERYFAGQSSYWDDEVFVLARVQDKPHEYVRASDRIRQSREFALEAVRADGFCYNYLRRTFQGDKEIALMALRSCPSVYRFVPGDLKRDREINVAAARDSAIYRDCSHQMRHDRDVVLSLVDGYPNHRCFYTPFRADFPLKFWGDREIALKMVQKLPASYFYLSDDLRMDKQLVLAAFEAAHDEHVQYPKKKPDCLDTFSATCTAKLAWVPEPLRHDPEVIRTAINSEPGNYNDLPVEVKKDKELTLFALGQCSSESLKSPVDAAFFPPELLDDEEVMSFAVRTLGVRTFLLASDRLKRRESLISVLLEHHGLKSLKIFSELPDHVRDVFSQTQAFKKMIISAIRSNTSVMLRYKRTPDKCYSTSALARFDADCQKLRAVMAQHFKDDIDILRGYLWPLDIVSHSSFRCDILPALPLNMRDNEQVVRMCIRGGIHGEALSHASPRLLDDREFIIDIIDSMGTKRLNPPILSALSPAFRDDRELVERLIHTNPRNYAFASDRLRSSSVFLQLVLKGKPPELDLEQLCDDREFMYNLSWQVGECVQFASEKLRDDKKFALALLRPNEKGVHQLKYFSPRLRNDLDVVKLAFKKAVPRLEFVSERLRDNLQLAAMAIQADIKQLKYVSPRLREDCTFMHGLLYERHIKGLPFDSTVIPERARDDEDKMMLLFECSFRDNLGELFEALSPRLRDDLVMAQDVMSILIAESRDRQKRETCKSEVNTIDNCITPLNQALHVFMSSSPRLQASAQLIEKFVGIHEAIPYFIPHFLPEHLRDSKVFMKELVRFIPCTLRVASPRLRGDLEVISRAVLSDFEAGVYATSVQET